MPVTWPVDGWTPLPNWIFTPEFSHTEIVVYAQLAKHVNRGPKSDGSCNPKRETLAEEANVSLPTIRRALHELVEKGAVLVERTGRASKYTPIIDRSPMTHQGSFDGSPMIPPMGHPRPIDRNKSIEQDSLRVDSLRSTTENDLLAEYLKAYDSQVKTRPPESWIPIARKAIRQALNDKHSVVDIARGLRYAAYAGKNPRMLNNLVVEGIFKEKGLLQR